MPETRNEKLDPLAFLAKAGAGRRVMQLKAKAMIFFQGDEANAVLYIQSGRAKLTVVSKGGKQATITLLSARDFVGEESVTAVIGLRLAAASAITACSALKITRDEMKRVIHEEPTFSEHFPAFVLSRSMRIHRQRRRHSNNCSTDNRE